MILLEDQAHTHDVPWFLENGFEGRNTEDRYILRERWVVWWGEGCGGKKNGISTGTADFGRVQHQQRFKLT